MAKIDPATLQMLQDYHAYHGDTHVRCVKVLTTPRNVNVYLMRFDDKAGWEVSSVDMICSDAHGEMYVTELNAAPRYDEGYLISWVLEEGEYETD